MANECLRRTPTSTGNQRVWTWSGWIKLNNLASGGTSGSANLFRCTAGSSNDTAFRIEADDKLMWYVNATSDGNLKSDRLLRDVGNWTHIMGVVNTTTSVSNDRVKIYVNGALVNKFSTETYPSINYVTSWNGLVAHTIGATSTNTEPFEGEMFDVFFVDGQALTPDVFGFYKQGKGYISAGSTQATDFRPGQWVPKTPRVIKTEINRRGGFGVNGFYLPMNDSKNFGADFHGDPNSIITLNEKLPQPRVGVATTASVGLGYTDALRADPYKANLVLAIPGVIGGQGSGYGDYSANIKGSGSNKTVTAVGNAGVAVTASYYGSALNFTGIAGNYFNLGTNADFNFGSGDFTIEFWRNKSRSAIESYVARLDAPGGSATSDFWFGNVSGVDGFYWYQGGTGRNVSSPSLSTNQWDHLAAVRYGNTITLYVNGVAVGVNTTVTYSFNNGTADFRIGGDSANSGNVNYPYQGSIQDLRIYKGVAKYTGGFDVPKPYTPVGIATWRAVPDTTANNFATLNPLAERQAQKGTISAGNLRYDGTLNQQPEITSTVGVSTGIWYYEVYTGTKGDGGDSHFIGICNRSANSNGTTITIPSANTSGTRPTVGIANRFSTQLAFYDQNNTYDISGTSGWWADGSVVGFAFDINNNSVSVYKNGVLGFTSTVSLSYVATGIGTTIGQGAWSPWLSLESSSSRTPASNWVMNFGQNPTFSGNTTSGTFTDSNGKGLFKYQPPSGFLALCEDNLPTPAISDPGKYFKTVLYTGDDSEGRNIVGVGFTPDLIWFKARNTAVSHVLNDSVRGVTAHLNSDSTSAESIPTYPYLNSMNNDGFSLRGGTSSGGNISGRNMVAWCWRAGAGTTSTNTNGTIPSVVSVNQDAGFSIVSYTGNGSSPTTVGHGLTKAPKFIIFKCRNAAVNWFVYHGSMGPSGIFEGLNTNSAYSASATAVFNNTAPSSSVITLGGVDSNTNGRTYIAYCWAEIEGFSKFGSYVGNANADGPFVYCGFKPAWIMIKRTAGAADWVIHDSSRTAVNPSDTALRPNTTDIDLTATTLYVDFLSNGFKIRNANGSYNNAETYAFAAFAESPFQTANSK